MQALKRELVTPGHHKHTPRPKTGSARPSTGRLTSPAQERRVVLRGKVTKLIASCCIARLVVLAAEDQQEPIIFHVDSPGGSPSEALGILSTMNGIRCPVVTFCRGQIVGPAAIIAAHGMAGHRVALANARFSLRFSGFGVSDEADLESMLPLFVEGLRKDTRKTPEEILEWFRSGAEFDAPEAIRRGLIDSLGEVPSVPQVA